MMSKGECVKAKLSKRALGATFGIIKGLWLLIMALAAWQGFAMPMMEHVPHFYVGYGPTLLGGVIGFGWGFVSGFIFGVIFGFIYNYCLCHCYKK